MSDKIDSKGKQLGNFLINGLKKTFSTNIRTSETINHIKHRSFDLYENIAGIAGVLWASIGIIFYAFIGMIRLAKDIPHAFSRAAQNNFRLGLENLKSNNLIDARIRFLLSNMFFSKSATTKYYIAYIYYRQNNISKSLKYLKQAIFLNPNHEKSLALLQELENTIQKN